MKNLAEKTKSTSELLEIAIEASIAAGKEILKVYEADEISVEGKKDNSPLTEADLNSNSVIMKFLKETGIPIISEENKEVDFLKRREWDVCWVVDPLDGTKEFIKKNGEFTVNIALVSNGIPSIGVIYVPVSRELYYANTEQNSAYKQVLSTNHIIQGELYDFKNQIAPTPLSNETIRVVGSRSHMNEDTTKFVEGLKSKYKNVEIVSKGSSLKFCLVAEGKADIYPRFAPTMEWDTAAGQAICNAVGLKVLNQETDNSLLYNKENLLNPYFLVVN